MRTVCCAYCLGLLGERHDHRLSFAIRTHFESICKRPMALTVV
jgi:hypothetical protein